MHPRRPLLTVLIGLAVLLLVGCGDDDAKDNTGSQDTTQSSDAVADAVADVAADAATDTGSDTSSVPDSSDAADTADVVLPPIPALGTHDPATAPADPLAGTDVESCAVYEAEVCVAGTLRRCSVYDTDASQFVSTPDPLLERVFHFDRWYDLYHQPGGQTAERHFVSATPAGTPESVWGDPAHFSRYNGEGDSAIWNGSALLAYSLRYLETGTEADYLRMEQKARDMVLQFEVTGVPGYLARYHYLELASDAPKTPDHAINHAPQTPAHIHRVIEDPESIDGLPEVYTQGLMDGSGTLWTGRAMFKGNPSIDQYTGPRTSFPLAYGLLRDDALKDKMVEHLTCYLKRLQRIEIINLQQNPEVLMSLQQFFSQGQPIFDEDDIDFSTLDTVVLYTLPQINSANEDTYPRACPAEVQLEPTRVYDAADRMFLLSILQLVGDFTSGDEPSANGVDHVYAPSVRGGDALHLMHLAATAYHWTGDEMYREFLFRELIENIDAIGVARTAGAFNLPRACRKFYGHHIGFQPVWSLLSMLDDSELKTEIQTIYEVEHWQKEVRPHANAKFNLMYASQVPESIATGRDEALQSALDTITEMGGTGGVLDDPRRTYSVTRADRLAKMESLGNSLRCPTEEERATCEDGFVVFGIPVAGEPISGPCTGDVTECVMDDGLCILGQAAQPLPMADRRYADFAWQRSPFEIDSTYSVDGGKQSPGLDLLEEYWMARWYGYITEGEGQVLAWEDLGSCP